MTAALIIFVISLPMVAAVACLIFRRDHLRNGVITATGLALAATAVMLISRTPADLSTTGPGRLAVERIIQAADVGLLILFLYYGRRYRSRLVVVLSAIQLLLLGGMEWLSPPSVPSDAVVFHADGLTRVMLLIINLVGPLICCHAIAYMRNHEREFKIEPSAQPQFFFMMLLFLGAMNGLVLSNQLHHLYFFFELTTLCSFVLISHDRSALAVENAVRALWMNSIGGAAFALALILIRASTNTLDLQRLLFQGHQTAELLLPALALLSLAAFVKSAQFPFQRWLLGAMVAPTPVSALLHASTMVNVGIYLALRLMPLIQGTFLSRCTAVYGGFVFLAAAALAVGQSNGKKVLAYSTISNLGLIFACAGLNTPPALTAAIYLLFFHAVTKALLFLCVGTIEQYILSRDIEDMRGLYAVMPGTALMTVAGVLMMIMPPFGVLLGKWMAMESAAMHIEVIMLIVAGSALTVMYWARWAGLLMSEPVVVPFLPERLPVSTWSVLLSLCAGGAGLSAAAPWLYVLVRAAAGSAALPADYTVHWGIMENAVGRFAVFPLSLLAIAGCLVSILAFHHANRGRSVSPYLCGEQSDEPRVFNGPMDQPVKAGARNYYLTSIFGEKTLTVWLNAAAGVLLVLLMGGAL
ncbi:oxidoreductase [Desulfosarcina alkanivorans]|uniref:Oxidoreductase n=1 Tax=Desulfosarcina alkanivorans TaxID=571177 RepID=A0A5K7YP08_9BACT|nr:proton-conducting transporter membrane subunit [Desulfosarcina alkanivorans]BBO69599.1 oxidoreductase [Desulfosarcina alkanivorans]